MIDDELVKASSEMGYRTRRVVNLLVFASWISAASRPLSAREISS